MTLAYRYKSNYKAAMLDTALRLADGKGRTSPVASAPAFRLTYNLSGGAPGLLPQIQLRRTNRELRLIVLAEGGPPGRRHGPPPRKRRRGVRPQAGGRVEPGTAGQELRWSGGSRFSSTGFSWTPTRSARRGFHPADARQASISRAWGPSPWRARDPGSRARRLRPWHGHEPGTRRTGSALCRAERRGVPSGACPCVAA